MNVKLGMIFVLTLGLSTLRRLHLTFEFSMPSISRSTFSIRTRVGVEFVRLDEA